MPTLLESDWLRLRPLPLSERSGAELEGEVPFD
jgi:hypothetical protein